MIDVLDQAQQMLAKGLHADCLALLSGNQHPDAALLAGVAAHNLGEFDTARACYEAAAGSDDHAAVAGLNMALLEMQGQQPALAIDRLEALLDRFPAFIDARVYLAECYRQIGQIDLALQQFQCLREDFPEENSIRVLFADFLSSLGLFARAALQASADKATPALRARLLFSLGLDRAAEQLLENARNIQDSDIEYLLCRADACFRRGQYRAAVTCYQQVAEQGGGSPSMSVRAGRALLAMGEYASGWATLRTPAREQMARQLPIVLWQGEKLEGKTLLLHTGGSTSELIHAMRYLPLLASRAERLMFTSAPAAFDLLGLEADQHVPSLDDEAALKPDYQTGLLDVPLVLGLEPDSPLVSQPYIAADADKSAVWRARLSGLQGCRVGIVWAGNEAHEQDVHCSTRISDWEPLMRIPGVDWISLQDGPSCLDESPLGWNIYRFDADIHDLTDTAALISQLDLVITVGAAVAHLAGAMGKEVWVLLPAVEPDYCWMEQGVTTPWYPSARLFRRQYGRDWSGVMKAVVPALACRVLAAGRSADPWTRSVLTRLSGGSVIDISGLAASSIPERELTVSLFLSKDEGGRAPEKTGSDDLLAVYLQAAGKTAETGALLSQISEIQWPAEYFGLMCRTLIDAGLFDQALGIAEKGLVRFPLQAELHYQAGRSAWRLARGEQALQYFKRATDLDRRHVEACNNMGFVLVQQQQYDAAADAYQRVLQLKPDYALGWQNLAQLAGLCGAGYLKEECWREVLRLQDSLLAHLSLGVIEFEHRRYEQALLHFQRAEQLQAGNAENWSNIGACLRELGRIDEAVMAWKQSAQFDPDYKPAWMSLAWIWLARADFEHGWPAYAKGLSARDCNLPLWNGEPLQGRSLLVIQDQGYGDLFQFAHQILLVEGKVTLAVNHAALTLMQSQNWSLPLIRIDDVDWHGGAYDCYVEQMRLPAMLLSPLDQPQRDFPYLHADEQDIARWVSRFAGDSALKLGFVWSGSSRFKNNATRSTRLSDWTIIKRLSGVTFYSLQKDEASNQVLENPDLPLVNLGAECDSFKDTAGAMCGLDLIVSTCTAVAHLAGAIGRPAWILITSESPDWRWLRDRDDSPWYPSVRLFRQRQGESWTEVLERLGEALVAEYPSVSWRDR